MVNDRIPNSFIYKFNKIIHDEQINYLKLDFRNIFVKIWKKTYLFIADTKDFSDNEINDVYQKEQIYINLKWNKISRDFINDYRKLKKEGIYFTIDKENLFLKKENEVTNILWNILKWKCLDVWCWDFLYEDLLNNNNIDYLWLDIDEVDNWLKVLNIDFEKFEQKSTFDVILFLRSINHFKDTELIINKALNLLNDKWYLLIVENELFWELKLSTQMFNWKTDDFEHYHNYSLHEFKKTINITNFKVIKEEAINKDNANQWYILLQKNNLIN